MYFKYSDIITQHDAKICIIDTTYIFKVNDHDLNRRMSIVRVYYTGSVIAKNKICFKSESLWRWFMIKISNFFDINDGVALDFDVV
jgi:hypothetical protein